MDSSNRPNESLAGQAGPMIVIGKTRRQFEEMVLEIARLSNELDLLTQYVDFLHSKLELTFHMKQGLVPWAKEAEPSPISPK